MVSQLLFGELLEIMEEKDSWSKVRNLSDNYTGWCTSKMLQKLPPSLFEVLKNTDPIYTNNPLSACTKEGERAHQLFLPAGSRLYFFDETTRLFPVWKSKNPEEGKPEKEYWSIDPETLGYVGKTTRQEVVETGKRFLNAPYLWGGKSILGIDCSGLVQLVFSILGICLPRDARDQAAYGEPFPSLSEAMPGDLAFFANAEGRIVHVGILLGPNSILHASGNVHIDPVDSEGIYSPVLGRYTHRLCGLRRLLEGIHD